MGREAELAAIGAFVADASPGPRALVLAGEAGIGKSTLWQAAVHAADAEAGVVLVCRGIEAEASLSFAGLSELLGPVLDEVLPSLAVPRRRALEVALLLAEPGEVSPDALAVGLAVLDVLRVLAERGPVVLAVDDLQWLDSASASALQVALRRLVVEAVVLVATVREAPEVRIPIEVERCFPDERLSWVAVGPVGSGVLRQLMRERLGLDLSRPELVRVLEATGGNPFFALEVGRALVRGGPRLTEREPLQVPKSLLGLLGDRLARLPAETADVLVQAAAAARPTVELIAAAYGDRERVVAALEGAESEGLVELHGSLVGFTHPLYASICYQQAPAWKRRAAHRALAAAATDVEERARHLAYAADSRDAAVAALLDEAAERAARRGAPAVGAELSELAADLTPMDPVLARLRRVRAARLYRLAGDRVRASTMLEELLASLPLGPERADVLLELAVTRRVDALATIALCDQALAIGALDETRIARLLAYRSFARMFAGDVPPALDDARAALVMAERIGDPALVAAAIARVGQAETYAADITAGLLERGAEIEDRLDLALEYHESPGGALAWRQMRLADLDRARALLERLNAEAVARGDEGSRAQLLWGLAMAAWLAGRYVEALDHLDEANELSEQTQASYAPGMSGRVKGLIEVDVGLVEQARSSAAATAALHDPYSAIACAGVLGRLELALGNIEAAGTHLRELPARLMALGINDPALCVWEDAIEVLIELGELELARTYLVHFRAQAAGLKSPWASAVAARCHGLLASAEGDASGAAASFEEALARLDEHPNPLERARTLLCMGSTLRRAQRKAPAREALQSALGIFEELGAELWAVRAGSELERISGRRPPSDDLTATEHEVATLAAQGLPNKVIAATLHLGVSTVEAHLSRVYRKLGVSRAGLAGRLAASYGGPAIPRDEVSQT